MSTLRDEDDREFRRMQREEARAAARGDVPARPAAPTPVPRGPVPTAPVRSAPAAPTRPAVVAPTPTPASATRAPEPSVDTSGGAAFRIVDELPAEGSGRRIPEQRAQLIAFAKANPGKWIEYRSTPADPIKTPSYFANNVRAGKCGFDPKGSFEAVTRGKCPYIRYVGTNRGELK
ncbi:hypothetical protein F8M49_22400 [Rhodococcus zopfii]|uniref:Uncharacterized protein n=1 Tax=Rhodococcus zopfii TaxID=43772 RepID=A0ABU3WTS7_9NOCA|nr:hypothetical protein [Rhodococcus zopfii]MDV2477454.1 hypothetical protein [Rhodococcus zopfii]